MIEKELKIGFFRYIAGVMIPLGIKGLGIWGV